VVLNLMWIPAYGIQGAAYATLISYFLAAILGNALTRNTRPIFWLQMHVLAFGGIAALIRRKTG
jgi:Na+-driven multidrug efflux pump